MAKWLAWEEPRAVGDLVHVGKFFARNLGRWVKNGNVRACAARPFYPQEQTSSACPCMSVWCQHETCQPAEFDLATVGCSKTSHSVFHSIGMIPPSRART